MIERHELLETLRTLMTSQALPLWAREGWDSSKGGFIERLDPQGRADHLAPRRVRVQARQIYSFATAARVGWYPPGRDIAMKGLEHLLAKAKSPDGRPGFVHLLDCDGNVLNPLRDAYDHAFVLLALAAAYELSGDARVREEIDSLVAFLDSGLRSPHGGFIEVIPATLPRRQNPQMHLFEAMIASFDATRDPAYQSRAGDLFGLFVANLYDARREALRYCDSATGCLIDEGDAEGNIRKSTRRLWPQTEIAKAWIAQAEAGEQGASEQALEALVRLYRHYLSHPVWGGWYDQFDRDNRSLVDTIPASSFYHIVCAVAEAERVLAP